MAFRCPIGVSQNLSEGVEKEIGQLVRLLSSGTRLETFSSFRIFEVLADQALRADDSFGPRRPSTTPLLAAMSSSTRTTRLCSRYRRDACTGWSEFLSIVYIPYFCIYTLLKYALFFVVSSVHGGMLVGVYITSTRDRGARDVDHHLARTPDDKFKNRWFACAPQAFEDAVTYFAEDKAKSSPDEFFTHFMLFKQSFQVYFAVS